MNITIEDNKIDVIELGTVVAVGGQIDDNSLIFEAGEAINGHKLVYLKDGKIYKASSANPECFGHVLGFIERNVSLGESVKIKSDGKITLNGWGLTANKIYYLGLNGDITLTPDYDVWLPVGLSIDENNLIVNISISILI